ncbi:MAG: calcium-binding protein [Aestuariivirga sp.]
MSTRKWGPEKLVNATLTGAQTVPDVASLDGGGFVVVWQDNSGANAAIRAQRYDDVGNKLGMEMTIISAPGNNEILPTVTALSGGHFLVNWTQQNGPDNYILGKVYDASGTFVRDQPAVFAFGLDNDADNARLSNGSVVVWEDPDANSGDIVFRLFSSGGTGGSVLTANTTLTGYQILPSVAAEPLGGRFVIAWAEGSGTDPSSIKARVFNASGSEAFPEFTIDSNVFSVFDPRVTWLSETQFAVTWTQLDLVSRDSNVFFKLYDVNNNVLVSLTGNVMANSINADGQFHPAIAALPGGGFVISWIDDFALKLQTFDDSGGKIGGEVLVNTTDLAARSPPSIAALADGRVVVTWTDQIVGDHDIRMQIVDPRDGIVTGTFQADTLLGHDIANDEINGLGGADTLRGLGGADQIFGGNGADVLDGGKGDDYLFGGNDNDTLVGGNGDDELLGEDGNDTLRGGAGADALDGGAGTADLADYLTVTSGGVTAALDASLAGVGEALGDTFVGIERLRGSNQNDTLRGDALANIVFGMTGADTMDGRAGVDRMIGGLGIDTLTGGTGADRFEFAALTEIGDIITDFIAVDDTIVVTGAAFGGGLVAGTVGAALLQSSATNVAANATVRFIFENDVKILWFDADGNGAGAAVMVADLQASATMTNADILIV